MRQSSRILLLSLSDNVMPQLKIKNLDQTEEIASGQTVLRDVFQPLAMGRLIFHCSDVFVSSFSHPLFVRIIGAAPYLGIRACACPVACRSSFTPEPLAPIGEPDGWLVRFFSVASDRTCMSHPRRVTRPHDLSAFTERCR